MNKIVIIIVIIIILFFITTLSFLILRNKYDLVQLNRYYSSVNDNYHYYIDGEIPAENYIFDKSLGKIKVNNHNFPLYRLTHIETGYHLLTTSDNEAELLKDKYTNKIKIGYLFQSGTSLHRLYNYKLDMYLYTTSDTELQKLINENWIHQNQIGFVY